MEGLSNQPEWHPRPSELNSEARDHDGLTPTERLEAARPQLEQLVEEMAPDIQAGRWDVLLGDDVSGRIPTLILRQVIARSYAEQGRPAPRTYFVAMGQEFSYMNNYEDNPQVRQIKDYIASGENPKRVLFVTDNVALGGSIQIVQEAMDELGIPSDVASVQEKASLLEQVSGHVPYSLEAAQAVVDQIASQGRVRSEKERLELIEAWTHGFDHGEHDPDAKYYGVESPISNPSQPFHLKREASPRSSAARPRSRNAVGVEKYGGPVTEGLRHHALRELYGAEFKRDDRVPPNPDEAELRRYAADMADDLYHKLVANDKKEA